jgi:hypothetical protein
LIPQPGGRAELLGDDVQTQRSLSVASYTIATFLPVRAHVPFAPIVRPD